MPNHRAPSLKEAKVFYPIAKKQCEAKNAQEPGEK